MDVVLQIILNSFQSFAIYSLATIGIVLIFRTSFTTNFAQGIIAVFGCYVSTNFARYYGFPLPLAILTGAAVAFVIGLCIDVFIIRRGHNLSPSQKQIITMGLLLIMTNLIPVMFSFITAMTPQTPNLADGIIQFQLFGSDFQVTNQGLAALSIAVVLLGIVFAALKYTKWGLGVRATASNEVVSQMMGINTKVITAFSWAIAGALATVAATSLGTVLGPNMMGKVQVYGFLAMVLGGVSSFFAPIIGTMIIPIFNSSAVIISSTWADAIVFLLVLVLILAFPNGLFGKKTIKKV
jgi:branched-chain amino acid transport system permease protein